MRWYSFLGLELGVGPRHVILAVVGRRRLARVLFERTW